MAVTAGQLQGTCRCGHPSLDHASADGDGPCDHRCGCEAYTLEEWWRDDEPLETIETANDYVEELHAREVRGSWEYAVVRWRYQTPYLRLLVRNGMVIKKPD